MIKGGMLPLFLIGIALEKLNGEQRQPVMSSYCRKN